MHFPRLTVPRKWFPPGQDAWNSPSLLRHFQQTFKPTTLFHSSISTTRRLTWLQKMLREIGESPGSITFIFRKWKEQTAWSLVGGNAERLICPNQDFSILFVTIFACLLVSPRSSFLLSVSRPSTQPRGLLTNSSLHLQH